MSEKMDYREAVQKLIKEWREFLATPIHERSFLDGKEMVDYVDHDSNASDEKLHSLILALLDKVREAQAAECAKHYYLNPDNVVRHRRLVGGACLACDWVTDDSGTDYMTQWSAHVAALGGK